MTNQNSTFFSIKFEEIKLSSQFIASGNICMAYRAEALNSLFWSTFSPFFLYMSQLNNHILINSVCKDVY